MHFTPPNVAGICTYAQRMRVYSKVCVCTYSTVLTDLCVVQDQVNDVVHYS